jgi:hypothetical protein
MTGGTISGKSPYLQAICLIEDREQFWNVQLEPKAAVFPQGGSHVGTVAADRSHGD